VLPRTHILNLAESHSLYQNYLGVISLALQSPFILQIKVLSRMCKTEQQTCCFRSCRSHALWLDIFGHEAVFNFIWMKFMHVIGHLDGGDFQVVNYKAVK